MRTVNVAIAFVVTTLVRTAAAEDPKPSGTATTGAPPATATLPKAPAKPLASPAPVSAAKAPTPAAAPAAAPKATVTPAAAVAPAATATTSSSDATPARPPLAAPADPSAPPPPDASAPPIYYVEPQGPAPEGEPGEVYEPQPPMIYEPPPPPNLGRRTPPRNGFWAGVRAGALIPFGALWTDGFGDFYRQRHFTDYASAGPMFEIDIGARLAHRYNVFALWEHTSLGKGSLDSSSFGGQERGATNLYGVGVRFSTDPTGVGFLMEIALGYRQFTAYWSDGTRLSMTDGWLDARIGIGADIRVNRWLSLSPMIVLGGGSFDSGNWSGPNLTGNAFTRQDDGGEYGTVAFQLGGHADIF